MRMARIRYDREMCYYHLMNRVAGEPGYYPFGDAEKEKLFWLAVDLSPASCRLFVGWYGVQSRAREGKPTARGHENDHWRHG